MKETLWCEYSNETSLAAFNSLRAGYFLYVIILSKYNLRFSFWNLKLSPQPSGVFFFSYFHYVCGRDGEQWQCLTREEIRLVPISIYVVVQFYSWFKFSFLFSYKLNIIHYHTQKQKKIKFKPGIKLNHNIYITQKFRSHWLARCWIAFVSIQIN